MPLPTPKGSESKDEFISRCVVDLENKGEGSSNDQRVAICISQWEEQMNLPIFSLQINEEIDNETGVSTVSIVREPAIELPAQFLNKDDKEKKIDFEVENEEERIITGPIILADKPIYRNNENFGEHYIVFDKDTIKKIMQKFFRKGYQSSTNLEHNELLRMEGITMYESYQVDRKKGIMPPTGYEEVENGSWFGIFKVFNEEVWDLVKKGDFTGFSIEVIPSHYESIEMKEEKLMKEINELLNNINL